MVSAWRRLLAGAGVVLGGALFTGCHAEGTFEIISEDRVAVDIVLSGEDVNCPNALESLKLTVTTTRDAAGQRTCRVSGETEATYFSTYGINVSRAAEYLVLQASLSDARDEWPTSDIELRFPGQVVSATLGQQSGSAVRITDLGELAQGSGLRVVAIDRPGPPDWVIAAALGTGVGAALALAGVWLVKQRREADGAVVALLPADEPSGSPPDGPADPVAAATVGRPPVAAGQPVTDAGPPRKAPPAENAPAKHPPPEGPPTDHAWFAVPPPEPPSPSDGPSAPVDPGRPGPDYTAPPSRHSVWAPPEDGR